MLPDIQLIVHLEARPVATLPMVTQGYLSKPHDTRSACVLPTVRPHPSESSVQLSSEFV